MTKARWRGFNSPVLPLPESQNASSFRHSDVLDITCNEAVATTTYLQSANIEALHTLAPGLLPSHGRVYA